MKNKFGSRKFLPLAIMGGLLIIGTVKGFFFSLSPDAWSFIKLSLTPAFILFSGWYCKINIDQKILEKK